MACKWRASEDISFRSTLTIWDNFKTFTCKWSFQVPATDFRALVCQKYCSRLHWEPQLSQTQYSEQWSDTDTKDMLIISLDRALAIHKAGSNTLTKYSRSIWLLYIRSWWLRRNCVSRLTDFLSKKAKYPWLILWWEEQDSAHESTTKNLKLEIGIIGPLNHREDNYLYVTDILCYLPYGCKQLTTFFRTQYLPQHVM
jgi:hypothetical protein